MSEYAKPRFQKVRVEAGDYLLVSDDMRKLWRIHRFKDTDDRRWLWEVFLWHRPFGPEMIDEVSVATLAWDQWRVEWSGFRSLGEAVHEIVMESL